MELPNFQNLATITKILGGFAFPISPVEPLLGIYTVVSIDFHYMKIYLRYVKIHEIEFIKIVDFTKIREI